MAPRLLERSCFYWGDRARSRTGIVVVFAWMLSGPKHLAPYLRLYQSFGWDSLVCHSHPMNLFVPKWAAILALNVLLELEKDLQNHHCPVVFSVFSGGHKACLYKMIQILLGNCPEVNINEVPFEMVSRSLAGIIFDSSPTDFVSHIGAKFVSHEVLTYQRGRPIPLLSWGAHGFGKGLDIIFCRQFKQQREHLWHSLYSIVSVGPILILCSESDELAPVETIRVYASNLRKLGGKVHLVTWKQSEHVAHFRHYPEEYSTEVSKLLRNASSIYSDRYRKTKGNEGFEDSTNPTLIEWKCLPERVKFAINNMSKVPHVQSERKYIGEPTVESFTSKL